MLLTIKYYLELNSLIINCPLSGTLNNGHHLAALSEWSKESFGSQVCGVSKLMVSCGDGHQEILKIFILQTITLRGFESHTLHKLL